MLVDAAKHLGLPIMQCSRRFSQGKPVAPFASPCRDQQACSAFSALFGKLERFSYFHAVQGRRKSSCITSTLCPEPCRQVLPSMFLGGFFVFWFGIPAFLSG